MQYCLSNLVTSSNYGTFLKCYYEAETFPYRIYKASQTCVERNFPTSPTWANLVACSTDADEQNTYYSTVLQYQQFRPLASNTPYVKNGDQSSKLTPMRMNSLVKIREHGKKHIENRESEYATYPTVFIFHNLLNEAGVENFYNVAIPKDQAQSFYDSVRDIEVFAYFDGFTKCATDATGDCWLFRAHVSWI